MSGILQGVRVVEFAGLAPAPFTCMMLADHGADVIRIDRIGAKFPDRFDVLSRSRPSVQLDLKDERGRHVARRLARGADVVVEGFRPGAMERLGLGPSDLGAIDSGLVYARVTGWGQHGPLAHTAGHDINYIALSGALHPIGPGDTSPTPPLNLLGDFAGGGLLAAFGIVAALYERTRSGHGQVIDAAMIDGSSILAAFLHGAIAGGAWNIERGTNLLDGGAPFYDVYATAEGGFVSVGAVEPQFHDELVARLGVESTEQYDRSTWPSRRRELTDLFRTRTRAEWSELFDGTDACVAPVLTPVEAPRHPHNKARAAFHEVAGVMQPAPAPRFARNPTNGPVDAEAMSADLVGWGLTEGLVESLREAGVLRTSSDGDTARRRDGH